MTRKIFSKKVVGLTVSHGLVILGVLALFSTQQVITAVPTSASELATLAWHQAASDTLETLPEQDLAAVQFHCFVNAAAIGAVLLVKDSQNQVVLQQTVTKKGQQNLSIAQDYLVPGDNTFSVELVNAAREKVSQTLDCQVYIATFRLAEYPRKLLWTRAQDATKGELDRDAGNDLTLSVLDSRKNQTPWQITATVTSTDDLPFSLGWKTAADAESVALSGTQVFRRDDVVSRGENKAEGTKGYLFEKTWASNEGVVLLTDNYLTQSSYSAVKIQWNLVNASQVN